jgi:secondary thiamine-phosphate synthase enzyme
MGNRFVRCTKCDITGRITDWTSAQDVHEGLLTIFCRHTSASLLIQENTASEVRADRETFFARVAPEDSGAYTHDDEGADVFMLSDSVPRPQ